MNLTNPTFTKVIITLLMTIGSLSAGLGQTWYESQEACDNNCNGPQCTKYYFDIDGDGYGVDDPGTNQWFCGAPAGDDISTLLVLNEGDLWPFDDKKAFQNELVGGCLDYEACNYNSTATAQDGSCVFPKECQSCSTDAVTGAKLVDGTGSVLVSTYPDFTSPCDCGPFDNLGNTSWPDAKYLDLLGNCISVDDPAFCTVDIDGDGVCDEDSNGEEADACTDSPTSVLDDCINCYDPAANEVGVRFYVDTNENGTLDAGENTPCYQNTDWCIDQNDNCNCQEAQLSQCGVCGGEELETGYDCDGEITCADSNADDICDDQQTFGCADATNCNYDPSADFQDPSYCLTVDVCGVCGGAGIPTDGCVDVDPYNCYFFPEDFHDCSGPINDVNTNNIADELEISGCMDSGACNYDPDAVLSDVCFTRDALDQCFTVDDPDRCTADADNDGICDDNGNDPCVGDLDACGVCNGTGIPAGDCDCNGNDLDEVNVCGGNCVADVDADGICDEDADGNIIDTFICTGVADAVGVCDGSCQEDADGDGICDDNGNDTCIGVIDVCNVCNGTGVPAGDCDCDGNQIDDMGICGGACQIDADNDGICDDNGNDTCVGDLDDCGVCNGSSVNGQFPNGGCDCNGNVEDEIGVCGGNCIQDTDDDGICDLDLNGNSLDTCVGEVDECGVCNGQGPLDCGCGPIQIGECDCDGNREDECGVCGGSGRLPGRGCPDPNIPGHLGDCLIDTDNDGICDFDDPIVLERIYNYEEAADNKITLDSPPIDTKDAYDQLVSLHERMNLNLNEGSPTGTSNNLTVEDNLNSNGTLTVSDVTTLESDVIVNGFVQVDYNANIAGNLTVEGIQFSNGGIQTSSIINSGSMSVGALLDVEGTATVESVAQLAQTGVGGDFYIHNGLTQSNEISTGIEDVNFSVISKTGNVRSAGSWDSDADVQIEGKGTFNGMNSDDRSVLGNLTMDGSLDLNSSADFMSHLRVNGNKFTVEPSGTTRIAGNLQVGTHTNVDGFAHIQGDMTVAGTFFANGGVQTTSVTMDGDLSVGQDTNFGKDFRADGSTTSSGGMNAGGNFTIYNGLSETNSKFNVSNATENVTLSGSLSGENLNVRADAEFSKSLTGTTSLTVHGNTTSGNLEIAGTATLLGGSTVNINGTGQAASLTLQNDLTTNGLATLGSLSNSGTLTTHGELKTERGLVLSGNSPTESGTVASFTNLHANGHGLKIQLGKSKPDINNNYVEFNNNAGTSLGRIRGETTASSELARNNFYQADKADMESSMGMAKFERTLAAVAQGTAIANTTMAAAEIVAASISFTGCFGFGVCATMPIASFIAVAIANAVTAGVGQADASIQYNQAESNYTDALAIEAMFYSNALDGDRFDVSGTKVGVTFESGSADYAEWMPKKTQSQEFFPGQIVGVHKGEISLNTNFADHLFVISTQPIVLGNTPEKNAEDYEKCAFLGQVPTMVVGIVNSGDYILSSGNDDGFGIATSPGKLKASDLRHLVGVAWESGFSPEFNLVNVAVGLNDAIDIVSANLESRLIAVEKEAAGLEDLIFSQLKDEGLSLYRAQQAGLAPKLILPDYLVKNDPPDASNVDSWSMPNSSDYVVHEITAEAMEYAWPIALKSAKSFGIKTKQSPTWTKLKRDDEFRAEFLEEIRQSINKHNLEAVAELDELAEREVISVIAGADFVYSKRGDSNKSKQSSKKQQK